ncbi:MAG: NADP(H)-dependent aldo-keto reductase [Gammaproteobacteria bacterium]|nr:NADP(H)-dependent aldo-keto reductase [Gammaproteobacteria bacterium]
MQYRQLGNTDLQVSEICLGTMTWGEQNSEADAHAQLDSALAQGVNFIDTAEMYPVPPKAESYTLTESYIGSWLKNRTDRDKIILATKVCGAADWTGYVREDLQRKGQPHLDRANIERAIDDSLRRLNTDYVDLYQVHWPDRPTNSFGRANYPWGSVDDAEPIENTLEALDSLVKAGKVRHIGISNETPFGVLRYLQAAAERGLSRIVSIQNPYSLLNRIFEIGLAEITRFEQVGLLAYSPLAMGALSGKYIGGAKPAGARLTLFERFQRYNTPRGLEATEAYVNLARQVGLDPAQMALAFVLRQPFVSSAIIGATTLEQLQQNIDAAQVKLSEEVLEAIDAIHNSIPNPCP